MGASTNIIADANQFSQTLGQLATILAQLWQGKDDNNKRVELMNKCSDMLAGKDASEASMKLINEKYAMEIDKYLCDHDIPHYTMPVGNNNYLVLVPAQYERDLLRAQEDIGYTNTDFIAECNTINIAESAKNMGYNNLVKMEFADDKSAHLAMQKLLQAHIPCSRDKNPDGSVTIYTHPQALFRENEDDMAKYRLAMAIEDAKASELFGGENSTYLSTRLAQSEWDDKQLNDFAASVADGRNTVLGDPRGGSGLYLEAKHGELFVHTKLNGEWTEKKLNANLEKASNEDIKNLCSSYADKINNMVQMSSHTWNTKFKFGITDKEDPDVKKYLGLYKGEEKVNNYCRPKNLKKDSVYNQVAKDPKYGLDNLVAQINKEACKRVKAELGDVRPTDSKQSQKAYELEVQYISDLLIDTNFKPVQDFLTHNEGMSVEDKKQWLNDIRDSLNGVHKSKDLDFKLENQKIDKKFINELGKILQGDKSNENSKEDEKGKA